MTAHLGIGNQMIVLWRTVLGMQGSPWNAGTNKLHWCFGHMPTEWPSNCIFHNGFENAVKTLQDKIKEQSTESQEYHEMYFVVVHINFVGSFYF